MKPLTELLYNLAALAVVAALAYFFFWGFVVLVVPFLLISLALMMLERLVH